MTKGANNINLQTLLPGAALGKVSTAFTAKYDIEGQHGEITHDVAAAAKLLKGIPKEIEEIIIPVLKSDKNIEYNFNMLLGMIMVTQNLILQPMFRTSHLRKSHLLNFAKVDLEGYDIIKHGISQKQELGQDIIKNMIQIIDNLSDYDNTILGILVAKPEQVEKALHQIDIDDFQNNLVGTMLVFLFIVAITRVKEYDKEKLSKILSLGRNYSEKLESYVDTIDVLSDRKTLESIRKSEEYYGLI